MGGGSRYPRPHVQGLPTPLQVPYLGGWVLTPSPPPLGYSLFQTYPPPGYPPPRVNRMTDNCENITFPQLLWWAVNIAKYHRKCRDVKVSLNESDCFTFGYEILRSRSRVVHPSSTDPVVQRITVVDVLKLGIIVDGDRPQEVCDGWDHFLWFVGICTDRFDLTELRITVDEEGLVPGLPHSCNIQIVSIVTLL